MNLFDFFYRQLVDQYTMDQAFLWAQDADQAFTVDGGFIGLMAGGGVSEQTPTPDLTVNVAALVGYGKAGERIALAAPLTTVDVSQDEYGTSTEVPTAGEERIISIFVRFVLDLQDPKTDGNGLTVYTKQLEGAELFVRMGQAATIGSAPAPAVLGDALLLADITRANGQTTIQNADISLARREDWVRQTGVSITTFAHGTAKGAIIDLFQRVDTLEAGGVAFSYSETWFGGTAVGLGSPPATYEEAFNAIPHDLASTAAGGGNLVGTTPQGGFVIMAVADNTALSAGQITNADDGQAIVYDILADTPGYVLAYDLTGTWSAGVGVDVGATYSAPPDTYYLGHVAVATILAASTNVQNALLNAMQELTARPRMDLDAPITGKRSHFAGVQNEKYQISHCAIGGTGDPHGALEALENAPRLQIAGAWGLPYATTESLGSGFNAVDLCRGWDYQRDQHCVYVSGDATNISKVYLDPDSVGGSFSGFLQEQYGQLTIDSSGTLLSTLSNHEPFAVACNGKYLFVLCQTSASGATAKVYCYDVRYWTPSGPMRYVWDTAVPATTNCMGTRKADSRLVCDKDYVYGLLGAEDANTGTPLFRMNAADGASPILGKGDGMGSAGYTPTGGLALSQDGVLFYTVLSGSTAYVVPATIALATTTKAAKQLAAECRDILIPGWYVVCPSFSASGNTYFAIESWDYANNVLFNGIRVDNVDDATYQEVQACYDGTIMWLKCCDYYGRSAENHAVVGVHPAQIVNPTSGGRVLACEDRYAISRPQTTGTVGTMGRMVAWGPGLWSIESEGVSDDIAFLPLNRGIK